MLREKLRFLDELIEQPGVARHVEAEPLVFFRGQYRTTDPR